MGKWYEKIFELIYPRINTCVSCLEKLDKYNDEYICEECLRNITLNSMFDKTRVVDFDAYYASYYSGSIKNIVYNFKIHKNFSCGEYLVQILKNHIQSIDIKIDYLTYVPRDIQKLKIEGFDQSYFLARKLSDYLDVPLIKILNCKGKKFEQKSLDINGRILNVKDKFILNKNIDLDILENKNLLIVDDIATTYNTLKEVATVIKKSNPKTNISLLTIAKSLI